MVNLSIIPFVDIHAAVFLSMEVTTVAPSSIIFFVRAALGVLVLPIIAIFHPVSGWFPSGLELTGPDVGATASLGNTRSRLTYLYFFLKKRKNSVSKH